jgi:hypothetical protein
MEIKDIKEANKYETIEIRDEAEMWIGAITKNDTYLTYRNW